jgi:hypothetical protein
VVIEGVTVLPMSCHSCVTHVLSPCPPAVVRCVLAPKPSRNARPKMVQSPVRKSRRRGRHRLRRGRARSPFASGYLPGDFALSIRADTLQRLTFSNRCPILFLWDTHWPKSNRRSSSAW